MKIFSILLVLFLATFMFSCAPPFIELTDNSGYSDVAIARGDTDFSKAYLAMKSVLTDEFGEKFVKENKYPGRQHRKFVIYSRQNVEYGIKSRTKVVGFVGRDEFGQVTPVYYCWYQVEKDLYEDYTTPDPSGKLLGSDMAVKRFMDAARNERMEAMLHNRTMEKLNQGKNKFVGNSGTYPAANKPWISYKTPQYTEQTKPDKEQ